MADKWFWIGMIGFALVFFLHDFADKWRDVELAKAGLIQQQQPNGAIIWVKAEKKDIPVEKP